MAWKRKVAAPGATIERRARFEPRETENVGTNEALVSINGHDSVRSDAVTEAGISGG
jgi:hypothetical protein